MPVEVIFCLSSEAEPPWSTEGPWRGARGSQQHVSWVASHVWGRLASFQGTSVQQASQLCQSVVPLSLACMRAQESTLFLLEGGILNPGLQGPSLNLIPA